MSKKLILMRGLPGSGKSFKAALLMGAAHLSSPAYTHNIFSTDDYWEQNGKYIFVGRMIGVAHEWNQKRVKKALQAGVYTIIVDNTNTCWKEIKPYVDMAKEYGYKIELQEANTAWQFDVEKCARRNIHSVPQGAIQRMMDRWEDTLLLELQIVGYLSE